MEIYINLDASFYIPTLYTTVCTCKCYILKTSNLLTKTFHNYNPPPPRKVPQGGYIANKSRAIRLHQSNTAKIHKTNIA